jgi:hypothetical protein
MGYKEYINIIHKLLSKTSAAIFIDQFEIFFSAEERENEWVLSTRFFSSRKNLPRDLREAFSNLKTLRLDSKSLYLREDEETGEIYFSKKIPSLDRYPFFRRYLTEYIDEMKDWKALLETLAI